MPRGIVFWTAWRRFFVESLLARHESLDLIAAKVGCTRRQLVQAIRVHGLQPRHILEARHG